MADRTSPSPLHKDFLKSVARQPGVYLMRDGAGEVIYVGKARDLRNRLTTYANLPQGSHAKTAVMVSRLREVETILTSTEKEAFILEASLIKKYRPKYNVILRDDKNYPLLKVTTDETWPRLVMTRRRRRDGARYFGPFSSVGAMWETAAYLRSLFPLRLCKGRDLRPRGRPCLNFQMGRCAAPCAGKADPAEYHRSVDGILMVLEGRGGELLRQLEARMKMAAKELRFEEAAWCRDRIGALTKTLEKQVMVSGREHDRDVFGLARRDAAVAISVLPVRRGVMTGHHSFRLDDPMGTDPEVLTQFLKQYYGEERPVPQEILLPLEPEDRELLEQWLAELRLGQKAGRVYLRIPRRGDTLRLLRIAAANAEQLLKDFQQQGLDWEKLAESIRKTLHLDRSPERIECVDISNIGASQPVGSLVCFVRGVKEPGGYRRYRIKKATGQDDYGMMREVLERRLRPEGGEGGVAGNLPDLLMVDGGKGQLNVARAVLDDLGLTGRIELVAIAKEKAEEGEKLFRPGRKNPLLLARHAAVLLLLMRIRDETHRFAITYHRKLRGEKAMQQKLLTLPGVGPARQRALLKELGSFEGVARASAEELERVAGIGPELARIIRSYFDSQEIRGES